MNIPGVLLRMDEPGYIHMVIVGIPLCVLELFLLFDPCFLYIFVCGDLYSFFWSNPMVRLWAIFQNFRFSWRWPRPESVEMEPTRNLSCQLIVFSWKRLLWKTFPLKPWNRFSARTSIWDCSMDPHRRDIVLGPTTSLWPSPFQQQLAICLGQSKRNAKDEHVAGIGIPTGYNVIWA